MPDNMDLYTRRRRLRLRQWEVAELLGLGPRGAYVSEFETGRTGKFPKRSGVTRADYERLLDRLEAQRGVAA